MDALIFTRNGQDILSGLEMRNGKANPFGYSTSEVWLKEEAGEVQVGSLYCGEPQDLREGFGARIVTDEAEIRELQRKIAEAEACPKSFSTTVG